MYRELTYIEENLKQIMEMHPEYYDHFLSGEELSRFIFMLMEKYAGKKDERIILQESEEITTGDFFERNRAFFVANKADTAQMARYKKTFGDQTELDFMNEDHDISVSRVIRYMPAQWHNSSYFTIYAPAKDPCDIHFPDGHHIAIKKGEIMIMAPFVEHATPCYEDGEYLEFFLVRSSSFDKVFWEQLNETTVMSHFFRNALKNEEKKAASYLIFDTDNDPDIGHLLDTIHQEVQEKRPYSSSLANSLMSVLFSLMLRRYEDKVILPPIENTKWKQEFSRIFSYIQNHYDCATLQEVADQCGYSAKQVGRIVSNYFNMSYTQFVTFLKMDKAAALLKENVLSMEEISSKLGYSDLPSFYRAFKKYYRETPASYQKTH